MTNRSKARALQWLTRAQKALTRLAKIGGWVCETTRPPIIRQPVNNSIPTNQVSAVVLKLLCVTAVRTLRRCLRPAIWTMLFVAGINAAALITRACGRITKLERAAIELAGAGRDTWVERDRHRLVCAHDVHSLPRLRYAQCAPALA